MKRLIILLIIIVLPQIFYAQTVRKYFGKSNFHRFHFVDAIPYFEKISRKDSTNVEIVKDLSDSYLKIRDYKKAQEWYEQAILRGAGNDSSVILCYAQSLANNEDYVKSREYYEKYASMMPSDSRGLAFMEAYSNLEPFYRDSFMYKIKPFIHNSDQGDFSPMYFGKNIVFCSARPLEKVIKHEYQWNETLYLELLVSDSSSVEPFSKKLNTIYHEGPISFNKDQNLCVFTRNNYNGMKYRKSDEGINKLKLYQSTIEKGKWLKAIEFPYNSNQYSTGHPALTPDGKTMYFASDMPGGMGGTDIYITKNENGAWTTPVNLGRGINTEGNEMFPYLDSDETLFFASDGWAGLGGLDIFYASQDDNKKYTNPKNIGFPVNSSKDDFGAIYNPENQTGYFSSNRKSGGADDNIYFFKKQLKKVFVYVYDKETHEVLGESDVLIANERDSYKIKTSSNKDDSFTLIPYISYNFGAQKHKYLPNKLSFSGIEMLKLDTVKIPLEKKKVFIYVYDQKTLEVLDSSDVEIRYTGNVENVFTNDLKNQMIIVVPEEKYQFEAKRTDYYPNVLIMEPQTIMNIDTVKIPLMQKLKIQFNLIGRAYRESDGSSMVGVTIVLKDKGTGAIIGTAKTDAEGKYGFMLSPETEYEILATCDSLECNEGMDTRTTKGLTVSTTLVCDFPFYCVPDIIKIENIFFDYNKFNIRPDAAKELDKVVVILRKYPKMKIEMRSHTDSRGSDQANFTLSDNRAKSTMSYIIAQGIDAGRISANGYGEKLLMNKCANGIKCTEAEHQANRRTELKVLSFK